MKKLGFLLIILSLTIIFSACPPLLEDDSGSNSGDVLKYDDTLDNYKWFEILNKIAKDRKYVSLDLSKCSYKDGNEKDGGGGLSKVTIGGVDFIAFDPFPASSSGKDYITSIILPEAAQVIKYAIEVNLTTDKIDEDKFIENAKKYSAFRSFSHLRSVQASNVTHIGNFAFADCAELTEVKLPRVSPTSTLTVTLPDIDIYAFLGCKGLKEIKFNSAAVIGAYAFKDCTSLSKIDFPAVLEIGNNAFEGCKSLTNVFFEKATKIGKEAFKNCTGLKKAEFNAAPERAPADINNPPNLVSDPSKPGYDYDSVIFYPSAFKGCKVLEVLNVRNAWNVYFSEDVLANTGASIDIYLFDEPVFEDSEDNTSFGHLQNAEFLGSEDTTAVTLKKIYIYSPINDGKIQDSFSIGGKDSIAKHIRQTYSNIDVFPGKR